MKIKFSIFFLLLAAVEMIGQVIITHQDISLPLTPDTAKGREALGTNFVVPSSGANQVWSYTTLQPASPVDFVLDSADANPNFPTASGMMERLDYIGPQPLTGFFDYYGNNMNGFYLLGTKITANSYNISSLTGSPGDELNVLDTHVVFNPPVTRYELPMTMGTTWTNTYDATIDFTVIVNILGLLDDTAQLKRSYVEQYEVVGWGQVDLPVNLGLHNALLLKVYSERTDSLFLNGAPADPLLLIGVGLTQGAVTRTAEYELVVPGMNRPAMIFNMDSTFTSTNWANFSTTAPSGIGIEESSQIEVKVFPNPSSSDVSLTFEKNVNSTWRVTGYDLSGKQFYYDDIKQSGVVKKVIALPNSAGTYIVSITDQNGKPLYSEQVVKQ